MWYSSALFMFLFFFLKRLSLIENHCSVHPDHSTFLSKTIIAGSDKPGSRLTALSMDFFPQCSCHLRSILSQSRPDPDQALKSHWIALCFFLLSHYYLELFHLDSHFSCEILCGGSRTTGPPRPDGQLFR